MICTTHIEIRVCHCRLTKRASDAGALRVRKSHAVFYTLVFFWLDGFAVPAPAQVTQSVSPLLEKY